MNFMPKDQIVLLAGLDDDAVRARIWALPELRANVQRLAAAGLLEDDPDQDGGKGRSRGTPSALTKPAGVAAAQGLRHITLDDLMAEHLPERA